MLNSIGIGIGIVICCSLTLVHKLKERNVLEDGEAPVHLLELLAAVADNPANKDLGDTEEMGFDHANSVEVGLDPPATNSLDYFESVLSNSQKHSGDENESGTHTNTNKANTEALNTSNTVTIVPEDINITYN